MNPETFNQQLATTGEIGYIEEIERSMYLVSGLPGAKPNEIIMCETGEIGQVFSISEQLLEVLIYSKNAVRVGTRIIRTDRFMEIPVGQELLGQVIDPIGNSLTPDRPFIKPKTNRPLDIRPTGIDTRKRISKPLETGVTVVDLIVPLGKGQRELIIGDRKTGKTAFLMQTVLNQARLGTVCIYAAIGKKSLYIKKAQEFMEANKIMQNCVLLASTSQDPPSVIYLTPYAGMTIAEYFRDLGKDVLLILDDLTTHAKYYREISLLGRRFPGRNAYPGDIFYTHARLLERAGNFKTDKGENAITCLPVVETVQGDLSGYVQTNVMSMTDGHLYFDSDMFIKGRRPAVNPFLSVTRVGRQTQTNLHRTINRELLSFLTLFDRMQNFIHFGAELNQSVRNTLAMGDKILAFFVQQSNLIMSVDLQMFLFSLIWIDLWNGRTPQQMKNDLQKIIPAYIGNESVQNTVKQMIAQSDSFNTLLNGIRKNAQSLLSEMGIVLSQSQPQTATGVPTPAQQPPQTQTPQQKPEEKGAAK